MHWRVRAGIAWVLLVAVPAAAAPPPDAFCVILVEPGAGFRTVMVTVDEDTTVDERLSLWPTVDGDLDGNITPQEKDAFRAATWSEWPMQRGLGLRGLSARFSTADGLGEQHKAPSAEVWRQVGHVFHHRDYELPATLTEAADLETQEVRLFRFDPPEGLREVRISGGKDIDALRDPEPEWEPSPECNGSYCVAIEYVVVRAPAGWLVEEVAGYSYSGPVREHPHAREVDLPAFDTSSPYTLTFVREEAGPSFPVPGFGAGFGFAAMGAAGLLLASARAWQGRHR